ncbi:MAG: gliding motility-associated C-terminal domain-containing protein [Bacteroidales bacterium]|nr:gliding motility-associated C-terminal domain-containing protein [Bacteroidales bacterium]
MKKILLLNIILLMCLAAHATHQRSGEITYRHISGLTYEFTIVTYTFAPSQADRCELEILWGDGISSMLPRVNGPSGLTPAGTFCDHIGEIIAINVRRNVYTGSHTYTGADTYTISVEDPNRNAGVINIPNSVDVPFYVQTTLVINPFLGPNNSVQLLLPPIDNGCVGYTFIHNTGAFDPDGDSLSYKLVECRGFNGQPIPGYTLPAASDFITINLESGDLVWETPTMQGEFNLAILIEEWRNGILIGTVTRDLQVIIGSCENNPNPPIIQAVSDTCAVAGETLILPVIATDADGDVITLTGVGQPLLLAVNPASFPQPLDSAAQVTSTFIWSPHCTHVRLEPYLLYFKAQDDGTPINLIDLKTVSIRVIGPAPENLIAEPFGNNINLNWGSSICENVIGYRVYRRTGATGYSSGNCITGVPTSLGYQLVSGTEPWPDNSFSDDGQNQSLIHGLEYCYLVTAIFPDGSESYASNETCASLKRDVPIITNSSVMETSTTSGAVYIAWSKPTELDMSQTPGPFKYIIRRGTGSEPLQVIDSLSSLNDTIYVNYNLNTVNNQFHYVIDLINNTPGNRFLVGSSQSASTMFLEIQPDDERLNLSWNVNVPWINDYYIIFRQNLETQTFDSLTVVSTNSFSDTNLLNGSSYCYKIMSVGDYQIGGLVSPIVNYSQENCGVPSDHTPPCPPFLVVETDCDVLENILRWTNTDNYCPDTDDTEKYYIWFRQQTSGDFTILDSTNIATDTIFIHSMPISVAGCYAITAFDFNGNMSGFSNEVCIASDACPLYRLPNMFTPNDDGYNDYWEPFPGYAGVERIDLVVFNRWGTQVFESNDPGIRWDGRNMSTNADCPDGVYFFVCDVFEITLEGSRKRSISGSVHILR